MCCSAITQIIYGVLIFVALALTLAAMFTPGWNEVKTKIDDAIESGTTPKSVGTGILPFSCAYPDDSGHNVSQDCKDWWKAQPTWLKIVAVAMGVAVVLQVLGLIWNLVTFFACCCKRWLIQPLIGASLVSSVALAIAVILYYTKNKDNIENYKNIHGFEDVDSNQVSYSFYMALGGLAASILSFIAATITHWFAQKSL